MNKFKKSIAVLAVAANLGAVVSPSVPLGNQAPVAEASSGNTRTEVEGMTEYTVYEIRTEFSAAEVANIVDTYDNELNGSISSLIQFIISAHPAVGFAVFLTSTANDALIGNFRTARNQGRGLVTEYEYWYDGSPSTSTIRNRRWALYN